MTSIKRSIYSTLALSWLLSANIALANDMSEQAIAERIAPIGSVRLIENETTTQTTASQESTVSAQTTVATARTPESIYNTFCTICHAAGVAGAPMLGDKTAWDARLAKGRDALNNQAIQGFNAMPAKGTCMDCSDEDIIKTIDYMLAQTK